MTHRRSRVHIQPSDNPYPLEMIQQGVPAMQMLNLFGGLTSWQVCKLLFLNRPNSQGVPRGSTAARKATNQYCLRRLKDLGFVSVKPIAIPERVPAKWEVNYLTESGYEELTSHVPVAPPYRHPNLITHVTINHHSMAIRDTGISAIVGAWRNHMRVNLYLDDSQVRSLSKQGQLHWPMEPDGVLALQYGELRRVLFYEIDRGTESGVSAARNSWQAKIEKYVDYLEALRKDDSWFKDFPNPDVMVIAPTERRLGNLMKIVDETSAGAAFWFTTAEYLEPPYSFFDQVWRRVGGLGFHSPTERFAS